MSDEQVGRVLGSEHSSTATFRVVVDDDQFLQLDDLVVVRTEVPKVGEVRTYGVVTEAEAIYEGARYESDTHRIAELGIMPAQKVRSAAVAVTRVDPEIWVSADPGEPVERATGEERSRALYTDQMERPLPVGLGRDGAPVHIDLDFFDGRKGGHMSIAGISGVATKTSFALFFLRVLTASPDVVGEGAANLRVLVFNVKGEDLLWLDKPNARFAGAEGAAEGWAAIGVEPAPFPSVRFWAPPRRGVADLVPDTGGRLEGIDVFAWTPREFVDLGLLEFCFTDANDAKNQLPFIRERVQQQLQRFAVDIEGRPGHRAARSARPAGRALARSDHGRAGGRSSPTCRPLSRSSRRSSIPMTTSPTRRGPGVCSSRRCRRSCDGCTRRHPASVISCVQAPRPGSTATPPTSPWSRSSRCTNRRSASWSARSSRKPSIRRRRRGSDSRCR